jgi:pimeloyl-ACP methyl ester carboxylesterase
MTIEESTVATRDARRPTMLLVHGAWHGAWCWADLEVELAQLSWVTETLDLPSALRTPALPEPSAGMRDDALVIRRAIEDIDGPVLVVGHSYGGIPVTEAIGDAPNVVGVVYLAAFMLDVGECLFAVIDQNVPSNLTGTLPMMDDPRTRFYSDVLEDKASWAVSELVPQSVRSFGETVTKAGWRTIPATYVVCTKDESLAPDLQEIFAVRAATVERMDSGHSPFYSMPGELARLLDRVALAAVDNGTSVNGEQGEPR